MSTQRDILLTVARQVAGIALRLGSTVVLARALGPEDNGRYAVALLVPTLLTGALNLGIPAANAHYIARAALGLQRAWRTNLSLWLALSILGVLGCSAARASSLWLTDLPLSSLLLACAIFPVTLGSSFAAGLLQGVGDFARYNRGLLIAPLGAALGIFGLALARRLDIAHAVTVQLATELLGLAYLLWVVRLHRKARGAETQVAAAPGIGPLLGFGLLAHLSPLLMLINYRTDIIVLEWSAGPAAVGVYVITVRIAEQLWIVSQAMSSVLLPALSATSGSVQARDELATGAVRAALWVSGALALALALLHPALLALFGPSYRAAAAPLLLLLPGAALLGGARIAAVAMTALGKPQRNVWMSLVVLACNLPLNLLLVPRHAETGAALSTSLSYAVGTAFAVRSLRQLTGAPLKAFLWPTAADLERGRRALRALGFRG